MKAAYISKIVEAVEVIILHAAPHPCAAPKLGDFAQVEIVIGVNRLPTLVNDFVKDKRVSLPT